MVNPRDIAGERKKKKEKKKEEVTSPFGVRISVAPVYSSGVSTDHVTAGAVGVDVQFEGFLCELGCFVLCHRLVGLVVKASASRAGGPGFESR